MLRYDDNSNTCCTVCGLPHSFQVVQHFAVKLSEGKRQDTSCGGQICISLSHKFVLSCMCVVTNTCVQIQGDKEDVHVVCG